MNSVLPIIAAVIAVAGAVVTAALGARFERRRHREQRQWERQDLADRYSGPLLAAASALSSRLRNVMDPDQVVEFTRGDDQRAARFAGYAVNETLYRIGRYLCWAYIISREIRVLDLGHEDRNRELVRRLGAVQHAIADRDGDDLTFLLMGGEQWAIGEVMVDDDHPADDPRCLSYVRFTDRLDDARFARWFASLQADITHYLAEPEPVVPRLKAIIAALDKLVALLDPKGIWYPFNQT